MAPLNKLQKSQIKAWMQEETYAAVYQFFQNRLEEINAEEVSGQNEFETLRMLHRNQGRKESLSTFFNDLEKQAYE